MAIMGLHLGNKTCRYKVDKDKKNIVLDANAYILCCSSIFWCRCIVHTVDKDILLGDTMELRVVVGPLGNQIAPMATDKPYQTGVSFINNPYIIG